MVVVVSLAAHLSGGGDSPPVAGLLAGWGLLAPAWTGVVLAVLGLGIAGWSFLVHRRQQSSAAA